MAAHGGARPFSGRKKGSRNSRSYKAAVDAMEAGKANGRLFPVEVMLDNMWDAYDKAMKAKRRKGTKALKEETNYRDLAQTYARDVAPFCHTRLGTLEVSGIDGESIENKIVVEFVKSDKK